MASRESLPIRCKGPQSAREQHKPGLLLGCWLGWAAACTHEGVCCVKNVQGRCILAFCSYCLTVLLCILPVDIWLSLLCRCNNARSCHMNSDKPHATLNNRSHACRASSN